MQKDKDKIKDQLKDELVELHQLIAELEKSENQLKLAEEALRESEKRFREFTDLLPEIVYEMDIEGNIIFVNRTGLDTFGYTEEDFHRGVNALQVLVSEDRDRAWENIQKRLRGEDLGITEYMAQRKDGSRFPIIIHSNITTDDEGNPLGLRGIIVNITERKKVEEALRESEKKYRDLVENINDVIYAIDKDGVLNYISPVIESVIGYSPSEVIGRPFTDFVYKEDLQLMREGFQKRLSGHLEPGEYRVLTKSGEIRWIRTDSKPIFVEDRIVGVQGVLTDITKRKKIEEALRESEEKFRSLAEQSPNMIFISKKDKVVYANKKCEEIMGYKKDEFYSPYFDFLTLVAPECLEKVKLAFSKHMRGEEVEPYDYTLITKHGKRISVILTTKLINYEGDIAILGTITDITERKKAEEELLFKTTLLEAQSETTIDGILVVDNEGKSILFNKRFGEMWNIPQEILDTKDSETMLQYVLNQLKYPEKFLTKVQYLYAHKDEKSRDEFEFKDGKVFDRYSSPLVDSNGKHHGRIWYFHDITDQKKAEEALKQRAEELERSKAELQKSLEELLKRVELEHESLVTLPSPTIDIEESGAIFLYPANREKEVYVLFRSRKDTNRPALAITRTHPLRFQRKIGREVETVWLTSNRVPGMVCVDPSDTMNLILVLTEFFKRAPRGMILFEGVEYVISIAGFERFLHIVQLLNDKIAMTEGTIYMILELGVLEEKEARNILRECLTPSEGIKAKEEDKALGNER